LQSLAGMELSWHAGPLQSTAVSSGSLARTGAASSRSTRVRQLRTDLELWAG